jgi:hypothetical protein
VPHTVSSGLGMMAFGNKSQAGAVAPVPFINTSAAKGAAEPCRWAS